MRSAPASTRPRCRPPRQAPRRLRERSQQSHCRLPGTRFQIRGGFAREADSVPEKIRTAVRNNAGGHYNHDLFWKILKKPDDEEPQGKVIEAIIAKWTDGDTAREEFTKAAMSVFGSGWVWLTLDDKKQLRMETTPNQDSPLMQGRNTPLRPRPLGARLLLEVQTADRLHRGLWQSHQLAVHRRAGANKLMGEDTDAGLWFFEQIGADSSMNRSSVGFFGLRRQSGAATPFSPKSGATGGSGGWA